VNRGPGAIPRRSNTSGGAQRWCRSPPHSLFSLVALFVVLFGFMWIRAAKLIRPVDEGERWNQLAHGCAVDLWCETWSRSCLRLIRVRFSLWISGLGLVCSVDYWFGVTCVYVCRIQEVWAGMCQIFDGWNLVAFEACFPLPPLPHYYPQSVTSCSWQSYPIFLVEFLEISKKKTMLTCLDALVSVKLIFLCFVN